MSIRNTDGINMYPPFQSYQPFAEEALLGESSDQGEDEAFLEKPSPRSRRHQAQRWHSNLCLCRLLNASVLSCIISAITAILVLAVLVISTKGQPIEAIEEAVQDTFGKAAAPLHGHGPHGNHDSHVGHGSSHSNPGLMSCGSTPAEARSLGCQFDVMSFAWTPPACTDPELSSLYLSRNGPWIFYLDHNATTPLPFDSLSEHEVVWTEHSYHIVHCLYAWERGHLAMNRGKGTLIPAEMGNLDHTRHCVDLLDDFDDKAAPAKKVNAVAYLVYDSCRALA